MPIGAIIMVLLGCGDDGDQCRRIGQVETTYASVADCRTAMARELPAQTTQDWPVIAARCEPSQPASPVVFAAR